MSKKRSHKRGGRPPSATTPEPEPATLAPEGPAAPARELTAAPEAAVAPKPAATREPTAAPEAAVAPEPAATQELTAAPELAAETASMGRAEPEPANATTAPEASPVAQQAQIKAVAPGRGPVKPKNPRRQRVLFQSAVVMLMMITSWVVVIVMLQTVSRPRYSFRAETQQVLEHIRDNRARQVYDQASPLLRDTMLFERFVEITTDINRTLGGFREILVIKNAEMVDDSGGKTARVEATLAFDLGKTNASLSYHYDEAAKQWRLLGFYVEVPEDRLSTVSSMTETRLVRSEAPQEVFDLARSILELNAADRYEEIYEASAPSFKESIELGAFLELQKKRRRVLGKYVRILDTMESWKSLSTSTAVLTHVVQYEKGQTPVTFKFIRIAGVWKLTYYKVIMPRDKVY